MDNFTLFAGTTLVAYVMAVAFFVVGRARSSERFWRSWCLANIFVGLALMAFMFEGQLPDLFLITVPDCLLVLGLSFRWQAARQFAGRPVNRSIVLAPLVCFMVISAVPWAFGPYAIVYVMVNSLLGCLALASAVEFWRDRRNGLPSQYAMIIAYSIVAVSFAVRAIQGFSFSPDTPRLLPNDLMLTIHLDVALLHLTASGAFALSLAYERDAIQLRRLAMFDSLTGLLNRHAFESRVRAYLADRPRPFAIVLFDLDSFKQVNDTYGHAVGDQTLRACAEVFGASFKDDNFVARWGGEEFAAMLTDSSEAEALQMVEQVRTKIRDTMIATGGHEFGVTVSAGVCHSSGGIDSFDELMIKADDGLYIAKRQGRDRVQARVA